MSTPRVEVKDTIGAGDSFTAGLVMGLLKNKPIKFCHKLAVLISSFVCENYGAMPKHTGFSMTL
jgi:fructokinase